MAEQTKPVMKTRFETGDIPTETDFFNLIDSYGQASDVSANTTNIAANTASIAANTAGVATNTGDIAANTSNISTNTAHRLSISNPHEVYPGQIGAEPANANIQTHVTAVSGNPHSVTAAEVGIADAGGYFTGTDTEAALQELGLSSSSGFRGGVTRVQTGQTVPSGVYALLSLDTTVVDTGGFVNLIGNYLIAPLDSKYYQIGFLLGLSAVSPTGTNKIAMGTVVDGVLATDLWVPGGATTTTHLIDGDTAYLTAVSAPFRGSILSDVSNRVSLVAIGFHSTGTVQTHIVNNLSSFWIRELD